MTQTPNLQNYLPDPYVKIEHPAWSRSASIYQINTRQFTTEGTFRAAEEHLPRLLDLGVDILWLMPVNPIGKVNRKGSLGSPYAVRDYYGVNPELGTLADLQHFLDAAHDAGFHVILDWVANHTAWDNTLVAEHPEWYARDWKGDFRPTPWWDWSDIIDLNYDLPEVRRYMTEAMKYWIRDVGFDGFRCDVAGFVPTDFWNTVRRELDAIKPVFMLAEWESRDLHARAFDMTYAWGWFDSVSRLCRGEVDLGALFVYYSWNEKAYPRDAMRMTFVTNHDKNAWDGTEYELFGAGVNAAIVLSTMGEGMPLIYNGQEAGNPRRLAFFDRDPIEWGEHPNGALYRNLLRLRKRNTALHNGAWGARMIHVPNDHAERVLSFVRENNTDKVFVVINFSNERRSVTHKETLFVGSYRDYLGGSDVDLQPDSVIDLPAWGYKVFTAKR